MDLTIADIFALLAVASVVFGFGLRGLIQVLRIKRLQRSLGNLYWPFIIAMDQKNDRRRRPRSSLRIHTDEQ
jgi:hypothetical protein